MSRVLRTRSEAETDSEISSLPAPFASVTSTSSSPTASMSDDDATSSKGVASASDSHSDSHSIWAASSSDTASDIDGTASVLRILNGTPLCSMPGYIYVRSS